MTLTELRYIVAVARERHFGRAAEACFVSQPTLSVAVKKLEEELGVTLFERGPGEVSVTPPGQKIVEQAQRVLEEAARIREIAAAGRDPLVGPLRLGAIYTIGPYLLPKLVPIMRRTAPQMPLLIQENFTHNLAESLKSGEVDVILIALPFEEPGIATRAVYDEPFLVAVPKGHEWQERKRISSDELTRESLLLLGEGHCFRDQVLDICHVVRAKDRSALAKTVDWIHARANLTFVFYECEEVSLERNGLRKLFPEQPQLATADLAILLEPTDNALELGCLGTLNAKITARGRAAHSARPWLGENAIAKAVPFLARFASLAPRPVTVGGVEFLETADLRKVLEDLHKDLNSGLADSAPAGVSNPEELITSLTDYRAKWAELLADGVIAEQPEEAGFHNGESGERG